MANLVDTDPEYDMGGIQNVGVVYLYHGGTHALISTLTGSSANDQVGNSGVVALANGNYVVRSLLWNGNRGAATWSLGASGSNGVVSEQNSLIGSSAGDTVGSSVVALSNGNYVVSSPQWNGARGAATWGNGASGSSGVVTTTNSLVGSSANDRVGSNGAVALSNGNYVVVSEFWNGRMGAATWGNGASGSSGVVTTTNSLVSSSANDEVGSYGVVALTNGNYKRK